MISASAVKELRERTGAAMMACKKALTEANGDAEKAIEILREKGLAAAAKKAGRIASEGLVLSYVDENSKNGAVAEINCETDFVANTDTIKQFAADICLHIAAMKPVCINPEDVDPALIEKERDIFKAQMASSGKPEKIIDQIVQGKLNKLFSEICLMQQPFIKNDKLTIDELLKEIIGKLGESVKIKRFARFEIGA